jgi:hypothetical protein
MIFQNSKNLLKLTRTTKAEIGDENVEKNYVEKRQGENDFLFIHLCFLHVRRVSYSLSKTFYSFAEFFASPTSRVTCAQVFN